jgi:hypothetical protein
MKTTWEDILMALSYGLAVVLIAFVLAYSLCYLIEPINVDSEKYLGE